jgi:hypothetical protein
MVGQTRKNIKSLVPFGSHGFIFLKEEWRNKPTRLGKLEPVAASCRMLGYSDDDETEEMRGYKVLVTESWEGLPLTDPYVVYSNEVTFDETKPMSALQMEKPFEMDDTLFEEVDEEFLNEPELLDDSEVEESSGDESAFSALTQNEILELKNVVKETYGNWFDSSNCCGLSPLEVVYAMMALTDGN